MVAPKLMQKMSKISQDLTADEFNSVQKAIAETIESTGLSRKGVSILTATADNMDEVTKVMAKEFEANTITKYLPKVLKDMQSSITGSTVAKGQNAFYTMASKKIVVPEGKALALSVFHEMGHAANANLSKFGKALQKCRPLTILAVPISLIALWKTKKAPGDEPKGPAGKATTFIKEHAGALTFATFIPMLLEEGLATLKGNKFAKGLSQLGNAVITPEIAKKVAKSNALGFATYLGLAALSSIGIYAGTKVKDAIAKPKPIEKA